MTEDSAMVRVTIRVPESTKEQLIEWARQSGVRESAFLQMALVLGAKTLRQQFAPQDSLPPEMWGQIVETIASRTLGRDAEPVLSREQ